MENRLLRVVKRIKTARKILAKGNVTIFRRTIHGYNMKGEIRKNLIQDRFFEVYEGEFYNYQRHLRENESVERCGLSWFLI